MDLKWWPVAAIGATCLLAVIVLAAMLSMSAARKQLRPLANVARLTRLPEYVKAARLRSLSTIVTLVVLTVMFLAAAWAAARPTVASKDFDSAYPEDLMLCVGQPLTDAPTAELLDYFARWTAASPQAQRIGLTSLDRRIVPLTRDHQYASAQFGRYAVTHSVALSTSFAPPMQYVDYAESVNDVLALCLSGFPMGKQSSTHRRSVIYLGPSELRAPEDRRPALFTDDSLRSLAMRVGAQVDVIDTAPSSVSGLLVALTEQTGGHYVAPGPESVTAALREMHAPPARRADGTVVTADFYDAPVVPLVIALLSAVVLSVSMMVLRR